MAGGEGQKSVGQWVGAIVGAVVGYFVPGGYVLVGAAIGSAIGGLVDPPKGPSITGPRLQDLSAQTSTFGAPLARVHGTVALHGNVIWLENNHIKETIRKKKQGGKGGSSATVKTYTYSATFAVSLCDAPPSGIAGVRRVWIGSDLIYNAGSDNLETIIASNQAEGGLFKVYPGSDDQMPDPRIEAEMGVGNAPAFRGTAYIMLYDLPLGKYGNSILGAQVKVEVVSSQDEIGTPFIVTMSGIGPAVNSYNYSGCCSLLDDSGSGHILFMSGGRFTLNTLLTTGGILQRGVGDFSGISFGALNGSIDVAGYAYYVTPDSVPTLIVNDRSFLPSSLSAALGSKVFKLGNTLAVQLTAVGGQRIEVFDWRNSGLIVAHDIANHYIFALEDESTLIGMASDNRTISRFSTSELSLISSFQIDADWPGGASNPNIMNHNYTSACVSDGVLYAFDPASTIKTLIAIDLNAEAELWRRVIDTPADVGSISGNRIDVKSGVFSIYQRGSSEASPSRIHRFKLFDYQYGAVPLSDVVASELTRTELITGADIDLAELDGDLVRGYRPAGIQQARACVAPLQAAYPFDLIMSGYQIKAVRRGKSSVVTIPIELLDARAYGDEMGSQLEQSREMDPQLPRQLLLHYLDADREYDIGEQRSAERMSTQAVDVREVELPLVLTPDEGAQAVDVLFNVAWLERTPATFRLPPVYLGLEPADVITIDAPYGQFELRLMEVNYLPDGRLECSARPNSAPNYTSIAVGGQGPIPSGEVPLAGATIPLLLDIPLVRDEDNEPGFALAVAGETSSWLGGVLFRSTDEGQTWTDIQAFDAPVTLGFARNALSSNSGLLVDRGSQLRVDLVAGELESITEAQMMTGMHWCAYGADGRWELIRFADAVLRSDGSYVLSTLIRGARGTEWATGLHQAGDAFVLLDDPDILAIGSPVESLGLAREYRAVSVGQSIDSVLSQQFTYRGVNLKPLSPVHPSARRNGNDWAIRWIERSRLSTSWWTTGVERPLGEATESYQIDVMNGGSVARTLTSTTNSVTYTEAQQVEDFGAPQTSITYRIYMMSAVVGRGYVLEAAA